MQREPWRRLIVLQSRAQPIRLLAEEALDLVDRRLPFAGGERGFVRPDEQCCCKGDEGLLVDRQL